MAETCPKAFISYSWSSPRHQDVIRSYAERLVSDGVDVVLDQWELSEGQDKYKFMERMVADSSVSHVIIFSDAVYARKADDRQAGVGTESQIISKEVYEKSDQKKFIPVVCERRDDDDPCLPIFLKSRIWIDFSTPARVAENWESLLRALYGKPIHEKPTLGAPPSYLLQEEGRSALPTIGKYNALRNALLEGKPSIPAFRCDFVDAAIGYADGLRVRDAVDVEHQEERVLEDLRTLLPLRDQLVGWLTLEATITEQAKLQAIVIEFLERTLALKYRPPEITSWRRGMFDAHEIFVYEMFLYVVAVLVKAKYFLLVRKLLSTHYLPPESEARRDPGLVMFGEFYTHSETLENRNRRLKRRRLSPIADLIKERATLDGLPFRDIMQAELLVFLVAIACNRSRWYPHTAVYCARGGCRFPIFLRAAQHEYFGELRVMTGVNSADELRTRFSQGLDKSGRFLEPLALGGDVDFWSDMNMDELDTLE